MTPGPVVEDTLTSTTHLPPKGCPPVAASDIADCLDEVRATVTSTLYRLEARGSIAREPYQGRELAVRVTARNGADDPARSDRRGDA